VQTEIGEGPESTITRQTTNLFNHFGWKCEANGTLLLDAALTVYDADEIPAPTAITLDVDILQWDHVLHLPALPTGFRVFVNYTISYLVTARDMESGENTNETRLNVSQVLDDCRRQEFTVYTLVNMVSGQSSSYNTTLTGEWIFATRNDALVLY
jgi:hypothetical protein